jgi:hypothetical protein
MEEGFAKESRKAGTGFDPEIRTHSSWVPGFLRNLSTINEQLTTNSYGS